MAKFVKWDVVVVPFPFSDLTLAKRRPAFVLASLNGDDIILSQITSKMIKDPYAVVIEDTHFMEGGLRQTSNIRPNRLFTADSNIILYKVGFLNTVKTNEVIEKVIEILRS
ncbi:MAG: growth inhibitor PemK [Ignavibacteriales bacterium CG_4_9_14_3_um_filter_30_11]|nr:MAG: growth inhibitor PemK [Ignavibacteriales bacterium CG_4_9_14_3_um_filter_30_11]